jgi:proteic killer suppression protein
VIKSFRHKGLERFFTTGSRAGIRPEHANKLKKQLAVLDNAQTLGDIPMAWKPHPLVGSSATGKTVEGHYVIWVSGNWRLTFDFDGADFHLLDYLDYH